MKMNTLYYLSIRKAKVKRTNVDKCPEHCRGSGILNTSSGRKIDRTMLDTFWQYLINLPSLCPGNPLLDI
jgi:hypothetical protein